MKRLDVDQAISIGFLPRTLGAFLLLACGLSAAQGTDMNPRVDDVLVALAALAPTPRLVPCDPGDFAVPAGGHLQGIQQATVAGRRFAILSGSSRAESYLALIAFEGDKARVTAIKPLLGRPFKHAGGFQVCGDYLAVGIEDDNTKEVSKIWIVALGELLQAAGLKPVIEIERRGVYKRATAGAVALATANGRHVLCVGTWDSATIDIYHSNGKGLGDPACAFEFRETWDAKQADRSNWSDRHFASYQNLNLVVDSSDRVFLVGFARTGGKDIIDLFELRLEDSVSPEERLRKLHRYDLKGREASFRHGSGLTVVDSNTVNVLACGYQRFVVERFEPPRR